VHAAHRFLLQASFLGLNLVSFALGVMRVFQTMQTIGVLASGLAPVATDFCASGEVKEYSL
jgi:hypothetical protein